MSGDTKPNHWVRRRGYSKVHVKSWTIYLEKNGYVKCPFQNCNFMAFDVEEMYQHYSICNGDSSFAKFVCSICQGRTVTAEKLRNHKLKAHDVSEVETTDVCDVDDENSNDDANDSTIKKAALSKVVILSWKCSLEENKYIKCPECDYLEKDVSAMVNHYVDCKKDSVIACYVCPECKGKAVSLDILQCHMSYAHKVDTNKLNFNKISPRMVQIWYDEIAHNKFARCLHKSRGIVDCLYFDTGISGIILHYQTCNGLDSSLGTRHTCKHCKHWTDCEEKVQVHVELCHVNPLVSRCSEIATRNSKNVEINSCCKSKMAHKDFKVKIQCKDKCVKVDTTRKVTVKEEEKYQRCEAETSIKRDSMGYNLFDEVTDVAEIIDGKADVDDFTINSTNDKRTVQSDIDLPPEITESTSAVYCLTKEEDTFLRSDLMASPDLHEQTRCSDESSAVCEENVETVSGVQEEITKTVKNIIYAEGNRRGLSSSPRGSISKPLKSKENIKHTVELNKLNQNMKADDASVNTVVLSDAAEVTNPKNSFIVDETLSKNILNSDGNSSNKSKCESQQESYENVDKLSFGIIDVKEPDTDKNEEANTVCNYVVEVCKEDENKDVLCFKITDLDEPKSSIQPVEGENVLHRDVTQSSKPDISFQADDGSVKNVYVLSTELADTNTQSMTDESNETVNDPNKLRVSVNDSIICETQEFSGLLASDAGTSGLQDDKESPRIVQFFKKGRLSVPSPEKKKVVCIEYKKDMLFRSRLARARCKPVFDDTKPSCSGAEVETKLESCLRQMKASSDNLVSGTEGTTNTGTFQTTNNVDVSVNTSEPSLVSKEELPEREIVRDNSTHMLKNDDSGIIKTDFVDTVESLEDTIKYEQQSELNVTASGRVVGSKETVVDIDKRNIETLCENSNKDKNTDCQNDSKLDTTLTMKASQGNELDDSSVINSKSSNLESNVKSIVSEDGYIDNKKENNLFVKEAIVAETNTTETLNEEKIDICSGERSDDKNNKEKIIADVRILKNNEGNVKKCMRNVGVRVRLGVKIEEMSAAKLKKMKRPIKNLVRKFCKEELRKYASAKKYFHSKKPTKNIVKKLKTENTEECQPVEEEPSLNLLQAFECEDESHRKFPGEKSNHQKLDDCMLRKTEEKTLKRDDSKNILIPAQESEMRAVDSCNQLIIQNTSQNNLIKEIKYADKQEGNVTSKTITSDSSESIATSGAQAAECETEPLNSESAEEPNRSKTLRKRKKGKLTDCKDAGISQDTVRTVDEFLNKGELKKDLRPAEISELPEEQESSISKTINPKEVNKPVSGKVKITICEGENNDGVVTKEVKTKSPKKYLIKKVNVEKDGCRSSVDDVKKNIQLAGQDKTMKCDDVNTLNLARNIECFDCEDGILLPRTVAKTELVNNSKKEEILKDAISSQDIKEPEMNLVRKVKYVDELEANYSSKKLIVNDDEKEILIVLTEDVDCETGTEEVERTGGNINNDKTKESNDSAKNSDSSKSVQTVSTDRNKHNDSEKAMNANNVNTSDGMPIKRRRGRPSKQELLQRKLNESGNASGALPNLASDLSSQLSDSAASSASNTLSRVRRRTCISKRYLEDESPSVSSSERRRRSRNQSLWYMTPENSNDSTDSSQPAYKRGRFSRASDEDDKRTQSSNEDDDRSVDTSTFDERKHSNKIDSGSSGETEINKEAVGQVEGESKIGEQSNLKDACTSNEATPVKRKRGRPRKNFNNTNDLSQSNSLNKPVSQRRSKAPVDSGDDDDNADNDTVGADSESESSKRRSVIKTKAFCKIQGGEEVANSLLQANSEENYDDSSSWDEKVKCGRCGEEIIRRKYLREHKAKHYNLCWLDGEEPIDFTNQDEVVTILLKLQKKSPIKLSFKCETCGAVKKSAVGYQSHMAFCGKSMEEREALMERCPLCGRIMMPSSLKVHMGAVHNNNKPVPIREEETLNFVRGKRAAASKAESALQDSLADNDDLEITHKKRSRSPIDEVTRQLYKRPALKMNPHQLSRWRKMIAESGFGTCYFPMCSFQSSDVESLRDHSKTCPHSPPKVYSCRQCDFETGEEQEMISHVRAKHEDSLIASCAPSDDSSSEGEGSHDSAQTSLVKKYPKLKFVRRLGKLHGYRFFHHALRWTREMREENYSKYGLFNDLKPRLSEWTNMDEDKVEQYLPKTRTSVRLVTENEEWRQIQLFESDFIDDVLTLFAGGPVWAAAWAPVPDTESRQYLAVSCHPDMDFEHAMGRTYTYKSLIQIWKFDQLDNLKTEISKPKMIYGIAHDHGAVWSLEWCPSGCYQDDRIGIFAAACSDGFIYIYSVPREDADGSCKICKPKPSAVLNLGSEMVSQCTRLSWHKVSPHSVLAAGFASGMVGLWDLNTKSPLLHCDNVYYPYHVFQAHQSSVSGLSFGPSEEAQYLVTASVDCSNKFWDLRDTTSPVTVQRRGCVTDSVWMQNWLCSVSAYDEVYGYAVTNVTLNAYRDFYYQPCSLSQQIGVTWSVSCNDWMNSIASADETGHVMVSLPLQVTHIDEKKAKRSSKVALLNTLHDFGKIQEVKLPLDNKQEKSDKVKEEKEESSENHSENAESLLKYSDAVTRYGLSFKVDTSGLGMEHPRNRTATSLSNPNMYPLTSITKVSWNTNFKSFVFLAAGYHCGIVVIPRTTYIRSTDLITFYQKCGSTN